MGSISPELLDRLKESVVEANAAMKAAAKYTFYGKMDECMNKANAVGIEFAEFLQENARDENRLKPVYQWLARSTAAKMIIDVGFSMMQDLYEDHGIDPSVLRKAYASLVNDFKIFTDERLKSGAGQENGAPPGLYGLDYWIIKDKAAHKINSEAGMTVEEEKISKLKEIVGPRVDDVCDAISKILSDHDQACGMEDCNFEQIFRDMVMKRFGFDPASTT